MRTIGKKLGLTLDVLTARRKDGQYQFHIGKNVSTPTNLCCIINPVYYCDACGRKICINDMIPPTYAEDCLVRGGIGHSWEFYKQGRTLVEITHAYITLRTLEEKNWRYRAGY